jgi:hypothetical protein
MGSIILRWNNTVDMKYHNSDAAQEENVSEGYRFHSDIRFNNTRIGDQYFIAMWA